jgi:hypothetical protein
MRINKKAPGNPDAELKPIEEWRLCFGLGLWKADHTIPGLELSAFLQKFDPFKPLQHISLGLNRTGAS